MTKKIQRQTVILQEVSIHNRVLLTDLAHMLNVSIDTVRRDITDLHEQGKLKKVHGGAVSKGYQISNTRELHDIYAAESKTIIAKKAIKLIRQDSVILMSGGTTNLELVRRLPPKLNATLFTPSLPIAIELLSHPSIEVILIGGRLSKESQITMGGNAINTLADIRVDICFLGTGYLDPAHGLTEIDWEVAQMKKAMIQTAKKTAILTISEKLNSQQRYRICELQQINTLITELDHHHEKLDPYRQYQLEVL